VIQLNSVKYLRGIYPIEFKPAIRRNPIKCSLCVKHAKCPVNLDVLLKIASTLSSTEVFLSFASGMVRLNTNSLRCLAVYLVKLKPHAKVPEVTHRFTQAWNGPMHQRT